MLRILHALKEPTSQNALRNINIARRLRDCDATLLDQLDRLKLELAAKFSTLLPRPPIGWETGVHQTGSSSISSGATVPA